MSDAPAPAAAAARTLISALATLGVREAVLAPGSRSAPLAYALADAASARRPAGAPVVDLHVRIDERSAAFCALGISKAAAALGQTRPVVVVTTSGTAVANLHPAVLEAHHTGTPLLVLTADRPHELHGTGANQTTQQAGIFGSAVRLCLDVPAPTGRAGELDDLRHLAARAVAAALGTRGGAPGPVHLNLAYREPLVPGAAPWPEPSGVGLTTVVPPVGPSAVAVADQLAADVASGRAAANAAHEASGASRAAGGARRSRRGPEDTATVIVAGDGAGQQAVDLAVATGWPLLAEPSSGSWAAGVALPAHRLLLEHPGLGQQVRRVVQLGRPTLTRPVARLLANPVVDVIVVAGPGRDWADATRRAVAVVDSVADLGPGVLGAVQPERWSERWSAASDAAAAAIGRVLDSRRNRGRARGRISGLALARAVAAASGPDDVLVVGPSNPVRDLDMVAAWTAPPLVIANRGLAGIDGVTSTAVGVALTAGDRRVRALMGDVTFVHDTSGLQCGPLERVPNLQVVVANDEGGSIFGGLEHGRSGRAETFERVFATAPGADIAALCAAHGVHHRRVDDEADLADALSEPEQGFGVLEVGVDRLGRQGLDEAVAAEVAAAVAGVLA